MSSSVSGVRILVVLVAAASVIVLELSRHTDNLEDLFFDLTSNRADNRALEVCPS